MRMLATGLTGPDADEVVSAKLKFQSYAASRRVRAYDKHSLVGMFFRDHNRYFNLREAGGDEYKNVSVVRAHSRG